MINDTNLLMIYFSYLASKNFYKKRYKYVLHRFLNLYIQKRTSTYQNFRANYNKKERHCTNLQTINLR